nr:MULTISPECIES: UPF0175 family protein [unclassified Synechocystis]
MTATPMTEAEMRQEIAIMLFQREKLTLAEASRFAEMHRVPFHHQLSRFPIEKAIAKRSVKSYSGE